jgi:hypothetical protein
MLSMRYIILSVCSAFAKNTKCRLSAPIIKKEKKFSPVPKSPNLTGVLYVKKLTLDLVFGHAWAPLNEISYKTS